MERFSNSSLTINLATIVHNLNSYIKACGNVMVMVKANAYGTDLILFSKFINTLSWKKIPFLGVSHVGEGIKLREVGIRLPIFVISVSPWEAEYAALYNLTAAVGCQEEAEALNAQGRKLGKAVSVHLLVDTGMNRSGVSLDAAHALHSYVINTPHLNLEGILTHFVAAESPRFDSFTHEQISLFKQFLTSLPSLPKWIHAANSGGAARFHLPFCNMARIGLGYVGLGPSFPGTQTALSLKTHLAAIKRAKRGETVGYNRSHQVAHEEARIGVLPFGYFDGFPRSLSGKGYVLIRQKKAPMVGTVCMDFMMIDLTEIPEASVGDEVILFDAHLSAETVAAWAQTDVREILVGLPNRVKRIWENETTFKEICTIAEERHVDITHPERFSNALFHFETDPASR